MPSPVLSNPVIRWPPALSMTIDRGWIFCLSGGSDSPAAADSSIVIFILSHSACRTSPQLELRLSSSAITVSQREESSLPKRGCRASTPEISDLSWLSALSRPSSFCEVSWRWVESVFSAKVGGCSVINLILRRGQAIFKVTPAGQWSEPWTSFKIKALLSDLSRPDETKK